MNGLAMRAQEQHREFQMPRLPHAVLIPCRMIKHDERARITGQRSEHVRNRFHLWRRRKSLKFRENRPRQIEWRPVLAAKLRFTAFQRSASGPIRSARRYRKLNGSRECSV
jgi:hypothetical protein